MVVLKEITRDNLDEILALHVTEHQGKGYGKEALKQGIAYLKERFEAKEIYTGVFLGNEVAKGLYKSVGFVETGLVENGMEELKLCL